MEHKKTFVTKSYSDLLDCTISVIHLSYSEIRKEYIKYPLCMSNHIENGVENKFIEIRFDSDEATITCTFNVNEKCNFAYIFTDRNEIAEELILYLRDNYDYDYIKNRWIMSNYYIKVKEDNQVANKLFFMFYA